MMRNQEIFPQTLNLHMYIRSTDVHAYIKFQVD